MTESANPMRDAIQEAISDNPVILFMKGTPDAPACGFSAQTVGILDSVLRPAGKQFVAVDVLPDPRIRQQLSQLSNWPTIPQLFIEGELVGGCDIVTEMYQSGELQQALGVGGAEPASEAGASEPAPQHGASEPAPQHGASEPAPQQASPPQSPPLSIENRL